MQNSFNSHNLSIMLPIIKQKIIEKSKMYPRQPIKYMRSKKNHSQSMKTLKSSIKIPKHTIIHSSSLQSSIQSLEKILTCQKSRSNSKLNKSRSYYQYQKSKANNNTKITNILALYKQQIKQCEKKSKKNPDINYSVCSYQSKDFFINEIKNTANRYVQLENEQKKAQNPQLKNTIDYQQINWSSKFINVKRYSQLSLQELMNSKVGQKCLPKKHCKIKRSIFYPEKNKTKANLTFNLQKTGNLKGWTLSKDLEIVLDNTNQQNQ